jgi:hypothetical protein
MTDSVPKGEFSSFVLLFIEEDAANNDDADADALNHIL